MRTVTARTSSSSATTSTIGSVAASELAGDAEAAGSKEWDERCGFRLLLRRFVRDDEERDGHADADQRRGSEDVGDEREVRCLRFRALDVVWVHSKCSELRVGVAGS